MKYSFLYFAIAIFFLPLFTHAQFFGSDPIGIALSTNVPKPNETIDVSLKRFGISLYNNQIQWIINGIEREDFSDTYEFQYTVGPIGESTEITAILTQSDGTTIRTTSTFVVATVDIVVEADTITPSFYTGRSLPSTGSTMRLVAVPITGENTPSTDYLYQWTVGDNTFSNIPTKGKYSISFETPGVRDLLVSVNVLRSNGTIVASNRRLIRISKPFVRIYEKNPLRGISQMSIPSTLPFIQEEITVRAEPYFMQTNIFSKSPRLEWIVNSKAVVNPNENQQELTLLRNRENEKVKIGFNIRNIQSLTQYAEGGFTLQF